MQLSNNKTVILINKKINDVSETLLPLQDDNADKQASGNPETLSDNNGYMFILAQKVRLPLQALRIRPTWNSSRK